MPIKIFYKIFMRNEVSFFFPCMVASMTSFAQILMPGNIWLGLNVSDKRDLFARIAQWLARDFQLDQAQVFDGLWKREQLGSTALGKGVTVPHARIKGLSQPVAAIVRLAKPIALDAPDGQAVSALFFLLMPSIAVQEHLLLLAGIAEMLGDAGFRDQLNAASTPETVYQLVLERARSAVLPNDQESPT